MDKTMKALLFTAAIGVAALPLLSQTSSGKKPSFEVVSIKPSAPPPPARSGSVEARAVTATP